MFSQAFYQHDEAQSQNSLNQDDDDEIKLFAEQLNKPMNGRSKNMNSKKTHNDDLELDLNLIQQTTDKCPHCQKPLDSKANSPSPSPRGYIDRNRELGMESEGGSPIREYRQRSQRFRPILPLDDAERVKRQQELEQDFGIRPNPANLYIMCREHTQTPVEFFCTITKDFYCKLCAFDKHSLHNDVPLVKM